MLPARIVGGALKGKFGFRKPTKGIEPLFADYETAVLPLNYAGKWRRRDSNPRVSLAYHLASSSFYNNGTTHYNALH